MSGGDFRYRGTPESPPSFFLHYMKKRILICTDASYLSTGYAKYTTELFSRLYETGKYELAELSCFAEISDLRKHDCPWTRYANAVGPNDSRYADYNSAHDNKSGAWRFESVCLDFRPTHVLDWRDPYVFSFEYTSPFRPFYHWMIMPTVDSAPQRKEWIEMFNDADAVFTYSDYGMEVLKKEGGQNINLVQSMYLGVDTNMFRPVKYKKKHKQFMLPFLDNPFIFGSVMRAQPRKLIPDLLAAFKKYLDLCTPEMARRSYLYLHTSFPDSWNIDELVLEHEVSHKVLFTYSCQACGAVSCNIFSDSISMCPNCHNRSCILTSPSKGISEENLSHVYNLFDVYIQYANCEGWSAPMPEAMACSLPIMAPNYSAMEDHLKYADGIHIPIGHTFKDAGTGSYRIYPDNDKMAQLMYEFYNLSPTLKEEMGRRGREHAEKRLSWDCITEKWMNYFDSTELTGLQGKWDHPQVICHGIPQLPPEYKNVPNSVFVRWLITDVMQEKRFIDTHFESKYLRDLTYGIRKVGDDGVVINREFLYNEAAKYAQNKIMCEQVRTGQIPHMREDYLDYVEQRRKLL